MEKVIENYFENAQLAMAAYAELNSNMGNEAYRLALEGAEMSFSQAEAFAATYEIIDQYSDPVNGFSGTVFYNTKTEEYTFAIRGTQPEDWVNDLIFADILGIAKEGRAQEQINAMNDYSETDKCHLLRSFIGG